MRVRCCRRALGPRIVIRDDRGRHSTLRMGSMAALYGPRFAAFYEAMLAPLLNLPRVYEDKTLSRATVEAYEEAKRKGERRGTGGLQGSIPPYSHFGNVLYRVEPRGAVTRVTSSCSGIRVGEPVDTLLYYAVAPQPARPCLQFPACVRPATPDGTLLVPCAMCQFHLRTAPETWLACGACPPGLLDGPPGGPVRAHLDRARGTGRASSSRGGDIDNTGPLMTLELMEQLHMSQPCRARCNVNHRTRADRHTRAPGGPRFREESPRDRAWTRATPPGLHHHHHDGDRWTMPSSLGSTPSARRGRAPAITRSAGRRARTMPRSATTTSSRARGRRQHARASSPGRRNGRGTCTTIGRAAGERRRAATRGRLPPVDLRGGMPLRRRDRGTKLPHKRTHYLSIP